MSNDEDLFDVFNVSASAQVPPSDSPSTVTTLLTTGAPPDGTVLTRSLRPAFEHTPPSTPMETMATVGESQSTVTLLSAPCRTAVTHADLMRLTSGAVAAPADAETASTPLTATSAVGRRLPVSSATPQGGISVMTSAVDRYADGASSLPGGSAVAATAAPDPSKTYLQKESSIRIKHATVSLSQLPLFTAGAPITAFAAVHRWLAAHLADEAAVMAQTCVGTVVRKTDPKMGARQPYAVVTLWDMQAGSPTPQHELAFLVCGAAFEHILSKTVVGTVLAVSQLTRTRRSAAPQTATAGSGGSSSLLRLSSVEAVRILGHAADLGRCESTSKRSGERCTSLINTRHTRHCVHHISDIRRVASAGPASSVAGKHTTVSTPAAVVKGGALTTHINFSAPSARPGTAFSATATVGVRPSAHATTTTRAVVNPLLVQSKQLLKKQQSSLFTVHGRSGLPTHMAAPEAASMSGAGVYSGVHSGTALPVTGLMSEKVAQSYPSAQALGVSTRGRDALAAAREQEDRERTRQLLRRASGGLAGLAATATPASTRPQETGALKRARDETALPASVNSSPNSVSTPESRRRAVEALKQQFAPLPSVSRAASRHCASASTSAAARSGDGKRNLMVSAVSRAVANGAFQATPSTTSTPKEAVQTQRPTSSRRAANATAAILSAAANAKSSLDDLRVQAARDRLDAYFDSEIVREKAREVLETVTEQSVRGTYCFDCKNWYTKLPKSCVEAHHRTESRDTKKRFIQCAQCQHKTFIIGESTIAAKVLPVCPQCKQHTAWRASNAAPLIPDAPEEIHPF